MYYVGMKKFNKMGILSKRKATSLLKVGMLSQNEAIFHCTSKYISLFQSYGSIDKGQTKCDRDSRSINM
jgi:hypothetical protein